MKFFWQRDDEKIARQSLEFLKRKVESRDFVSPLSSLPYSKASMRKAILKFAIQFIKSSSNPSKEQGSIEECYMFLANFMKDNEARDINLARDSNYTKIPWERYMELTNIKNEEEYALMQEIEQVYIDHSLLEDMDAICRKFISNPETFLIFRGERDTNAGGLRFTTDREWAIKFGETILQGRLPSNSKIHTLKHDDIKNAPRVGFTTSSSWFKWFIEERNYDAILATDPMSPRTLEIIVHPKHLKNFTASNYLV